MSRRAAYAVTLAICSLVFALGCGDDGEVGAPCDTDSDCNGDLVCDDHGDKSTCQEPHGHF